MTADEAVPTPTTLRANRAERLLEVVWPDGRVDRLSYFDLRCGCPCAVCIDEITGRQILQPTQVSPEVEAKAVAFIGNYALKIEWSDGHSTGIYTWQRLRGLGDLAAAGLTPPGTGA